MRATRTARQSKAQGETVNEGATPGQGQGSRLLERARASAAAYVAASVASPATSRQYAHEQRAYLKFCEREGIEPLDIDNALAYLAHLASRLKASSIRVSRAALVSYFKAQRGPNLCDAPAVKALLRGITVAHAVERPVVQARPIDARELQALVETLPGAYTVRGPLAPLVERFDNLGEDIAAHTAFYEETRAMGLGLDWSVLSVDRLRFTRDRAILLASWALAARQSEVMGGRGIRAEDVTFTDNGALVRFRVGKTDQQGKGKTKALFYADNPDLCPVRALRAWLDASTLKRGPLFVAIVQDETRAAFRYRASVGALSGLSAKYQSVLIKDAWTRATGESTAHVAGHSMRRGAATAVAMATGDILAVKQVTGHSSVVMASRYVAVDALDGKNPLKGVL